ncbi:MAG TPA: hypothetical protein VNT56_06150 [Acidimicrobiales bacterium]|nr:hypothetical protein [Acidimicrobiales bacterium]
MGRTVVGARRLLVAGLLTAGTMFGSAGVAAAQYVNPPPPGGTASDRVANPITPAAQSSQRVQGTQRSASSLPITGGDVAGLVTLGTGTVALGAVLVGLRRRSERG